MYQSLKRRLLAPILLACAFALSACGQPVPAGHVGVKVEKYGDERGVKTEVVGPGRYYLGWNTDLFLFPTFTQTDKWQAKSSTEPNTPDQSINFQASGGINVNVDIGISFHVERDNVTKVFVKYRRGIDEVSDNYLRNMVRDALNIYGAKYDVESLQGPGKQKLLEEVEVEVKKQALLVGVTVEDLSYLGALRFPQNVVNAINAKIQATQDAMTVENQVRRTRAEADKLVVTAEAQVRVAEAEAKAIKLRGEALRQNADVLRIKELENQELMIKKWNGSFPQYMGDKLPTPFMQAK